MTHQLGFLVSSSLKVHLIHVDGVLKAEVRMRRNVSGFRWSCILWRFGVALTCIQLGSLCRSRSSFLAMLPECRVAPEFVFSTSGKGKLELAGGSKLEGQAKADES